MPIFSYFAGMGSVLLALLFVADATLEKSAPKHMSALVGLPKTYEHRNNGTSLAAVPVPAPDMSSDAVKAAAVGTEAMGAELAPAVASKIAPRKKGNSVLGQKQHNSRHDVAWSRNDGSFDDRRFSGRF